VLELKPTQLETIELHARSEYPRESCGVLVGWRSGDLRSVTLVIPTTNGWTDSELNILFDTDNHDRHSPHDRYIIPPLEMLKIQQDARARGWDIIGFFHSHPNGVPIPSEFDRLYAWEVYSYLITSVTNERLPTSRCWQLNQEGIFAEESIVID
jgi:proteasome lid subunit RPN8/RPN11